MSEPKDYGEMSDPFPTREAAEAALRAFFAEIEPLREKYSIAEVVVCAQVYTADRTREMGLRLGNPFEWIGMLARAIEAFYAIERSDAQTPGESAT